MASHILMVRTFSFTSCTRTNMHPFGKTYENNLEIINCLEELNMFGYPLLLGCSRKSVIGLTLDLPVTERVEGTLVTTMFS